MMWCCPVCRSELANDSEGLFCAPCNHTYEVVGGIPDLRVNVESWIDYQSDLAFARRLAASEMSLGEMVRAVYAARPTWDAARIERRTREVLDGPRQMAEQVSGWLAKVASEAPTLDLGCGSGPMTVALLSRGRECIGIDVSMTWLVVAQRMIRDAGKTPVLAAAAAEALPLSDGAVGAVISLDVIEHVRDVPAYLREINRAVRPGGFVAISTPNRFSMSAEPHVFVWGVGWLPRRLQQQYVSWRSGKTYDDTVLLSYVELAKMIRRNSEFVISATPPLIQEEHIKRFSRPKGVLAKTYNRLVRIRSLRLMFLLIGPFFQIIGVKQLASETARGR